MKKKVITLVLGSVLLVLAPMAFAQSSGNFSASAVPATCSIGAGGALSGGTPLTVWTSKISTSNGKGVLLKITPSMVTGLFTDTKINTTVPTASADVGIQVCVKVDDSGDGIFPKSCVVYDQRFQQISSNLFSQIAACNSLVCTANADCATLGTGAVCNNPTGLTGGGLCVTPVPNTTCTTTGDCATGQICINSSGGVGTGTCDQVAGVANQLCDFDLILSTLSAHSFDFVVPIGYGKPHTVTAEWSVIGSPKPGTAEACVGPGIVTVEQVKVFNNSGAILSY